MVLGDNPKSVRMIPLRTLAFGSLLVASIAYPTSQGSAADLDDALSHFRVGQYGPCIELCTEAIEDGRWEEKWRHLKIQSEFILGRYQDAQTTLESSLRRYPTSIHLRMLGRDVLRFNKMNAEAERLFRSIEPLATDSPWRYSDRANRITLGRFMHALGADARQVLELFYDRAKKLDSEYVDAYLASADLALSIHDYQTAAKELQDALKYDPDNPELHFKLSLAFASSDAEKSTESLNKALEINPNYIDALLEIADSQIDGERYDEAENTIGRVHRINPNEPRGWAYLAVIAHLRGEYIVEDCCLEMAMEHWSMNPEVDYLVGRKLSQKYRFEEGAIHQRRALTYDPDYLAAKIQLSQDLLRLGDEPEGWQLAKEVYDQDGYNVLAFNLVNLREQLEKFTTLERDGLLVRMSSREAALYGEAVLNLLAHAKAEIGSKYEIEIEEPIIIEIFPEQKDFAIRTFGMPGGAGFLGVCFGKVVTANSPASQGPNPSNWQSVLWHEFCHVVTLQKTANKMPRWLSEGISVYEEREANPAWGQSMTRQYREMILGGELTPVSELSSAFLRPPTAAHLQFAYYESSMVVEFMIQEHGIDTLKRILVDLAIGMPINDSLRRYFGSLQALDDEFESYAKQLAENLGSDVDWAELDIDENATLATIDRAISDHPNNFGALQKKVSRLLEAKDWEGIKEPLQRLIELYPDNSDNAAAYLLLARAHQELGESEAEKTVLDQLVTIDTDNLDAFRRLMVIGEAQEDWNLVAENADRYLAVDPLQRFPHEKLAEASERLDNAADSIRSYRALLQFELSDFAESHFRLARLLHAQSDHDQALRHVLMALEEAPRYRAAHRLYLDIVSQLDRQKKSEDGFAAEERDLTDTSSSNPRASQEQ